MATSDAIESAEQRLARFRHYGGVVLWQEGPIRENGANGCQVEDVIEVARARLLELNRPPYAHEANGIAIRHLEKALAALDVRTIERAQRGVEGTSTP